MEDTLQNRNYLILLRTAYKFGNEPEYGDIVVFKSDLVNEQNGQNNQTDQSGQNNQGTNNSGRTIYVKFGMGSIGFGEEQVHNALNNAVIDAIHNKDHGLIAKLNGTAKKRKV